MEAPLLNHRCRGKEIRITYSECVSVALVIQHAKRMRRFILSSLALQDQPHYLISDTIFGGEGVKLLNTKCVF
jgi:hypothetical protein